MDSAGEAEGCSGLYDIRAVEGVPWVTDAMEGGSIRSGSAGSDWSGCIAVAGLIGSMEVAALLKVAGWECQEGSH